MNTLQVVDLAADRIEGEVVAAFFFQDQRPPQGSTALLDWRLNGCLSELMVGGGAHGAAGENVVVANNGKLNAEWVWFAGGGQRSSLESDIYGRLIGHLLGSCRRAGFTRIALCLEPLGQMTTEDLKALAAGALDQTGYGDLDCRLCPGWSG